MTDMDVRTTLDRLIRERGEDYRSISLLLGRNAAYIQQFIRRGTPRKLDETDRARLAAYLRVDETLLGGPDRTAANDDNFVAIPRRMVGASAGHGALADMDYIAGHIGFSRDFLRRLGADPRHLSIISVEGRSMAPLLHDGDDILVDERRRTVDAAGGVYVLRQDSVLMVKRLGRAGQAHLNILSDNPEFPDYPQTPVENIDIIGRVIWSGRTIH